MRIAVLRCQKLPKFVTWEIENPEELFADDALLLDALAQRGVEAVAVAWDDPNVDWSGFDLALIRSTWDYIDDRDRFLATLAGIEASSCRLENRLETVRWNSEKHYLFDLADADVRTVPTVQVSVAEPDDLELTVSGRGWKTVVLKPRIGAGSADIHRIPAQQAVRTLEALYAEDPKKEFILQPFIETIATEGEWSYVYIGGTLSHVLIKKPAEGDFRSHGVYGGTVSPAEASSGDRLQVETMLKQIRKQFPFDPLYARIDVVRAEGRLAIMELELIEPMLYLGTAPGAAGRLADAAIARAKLPR